MFFKIYVIQDVECCVTLHPSYTLESGQKTYSLLYSRSYNTLLWTLVQTHSRDGKQPF